jgi:heparin/heparan-sulfate lyase
MSNTEPKNYKGNLPLTRYMGGPNGEMVAMTGWFDDWHTDFNSNIMHVNMRFGINTNNHDHLDAGAFQIYYKGALAVDAGIYNGRLGEFGSPHDREWNKATISHNSILIRDPNYNKKYGERAADISNPEFNQFWWRGHKLENSGGQLYSFGGGGADGMPKDVYRDSDGVIKYFPFNKNGIPIDGADSQWAQSRIISASVEAGMLEPEYSYLKGDMTELYGYRAENVSRSFMFYNFKDKAYPGALIVFDRITVSDGYDDCLDYEKYFLLHSLDKPEIVCDENNNIENIIVKNTRSGVIPEGHIINAASGDYYAYNGQLVNTPLLPVKGDIDIKLVHGYNVFGKEFDNISHYETTGTEEAGKWMLMLSPKSKARTHLMLNVLQCQNAGAEPLDVCMTGSENDEIVGAKINGFVTMFSVGGKLLDGRVTLPSAGNKNKNKDETDLKYYIADLAAGKWTVCGADDNLPAAEFFVKDGENIGRFDLPARGYVLVRD